MGPIKEETKGTKAAGPLPEWAIKSGTKFFLRHSEVSQNKNINVMFNQRGLVN